MREILFRAIDTSTGKFVYGNLLKSEPNTHGDYFINIACPFAFDPNVRQVACNVGTEGQYTGLTDKHGVKIFEGDIVKWDDGSAGRYWRVCEVKWIKSGYELHGHTFMTKTPDTKIECRFRFGQFMYQYDGALEVIGNIYDKEAQSGK